MYKSGLQVGQVESVYWVVNSEGSKESAGRQPGCTNGRAAAEVPVCVWVVQQGLVHYHLSVQPRMLRDQSA